MKKILITGGSGYIGGHLAVSSKHDVTVMDLVPPKHDRRYIVADVRNRIHMYGVIANQSPDVIFHMAGLKSVTDSVVNPIEYMETNVRGTMNLVSALNYNSKITGKKPHVVFSSSATVYNTSFITKNGLFELQPLKPVNPYGYTKFLAERVLMDWADEGGGKLTILRYFNPVGAHPDGLAWEDPAICNNLMPRLCEAAYLGRPITIYGTDYPTADGTCERDFIHIMDLISAHEVVIDKEYPNSSNINIFNVGTGVATSVKSLVNTFKEQAPDLEVVWGPRRPGDVAVTFANPSKLMTETGWHPKYTLKDMCTSAWEAYKRSKNVSF